VKILHLRHRSPDRLTIRRGKTVNGSLKRIGRDPQTGGLHLGSVKLPGVFQDSGIATLADRPKHFGNDWRNIPTGRCLGAEIA